MSQSQRERAQTQRLIAERRAARGKGLQEAGARLGAMIAQVRAHARQLKSEQQRLLRLARTPGFRQLATPEEARLAWETRVALSPRPARPPRPRRPRKGQPVPRKATWPVYPLDWKIAEVCPEAETLQLVRQRQVDFDGEALAQLREGKCPPMDLTGLEQRVQAALDFQPDASGELSAPAQALRQRERLTGLLYELKGFKRRYQTLVAPRRGFPGQAPPLGELLEKLIREEKIYHPGQILEQLLAQLGLKDSAELLDAFILAAEVPCAEQLVPRCRLWLDQLGQDWGRASQQLLFEVLLELLREEDEPESEPRPGGGDGAELGGVAEAPLEVLKELAGDFYEEAVAVDDPDPAEAERIYAALEAWHQEQEAGRGIRGRGEKVREAGMSSAEMTVAQRPMAVSGDAAAGSEDPWESGNFEADGK